VGAAPRRSGLAVAAWTLLALAALVVLFVVYQLWGTGIVQARQQRDLRAQFQHTLSHRKELAPHGATTTAPPTADPGTGKPVGTLVIPAIGVDQVVVEGTGADQLAAGPGHYPGTPLPGQPGNAGIAGHRTTHGRPFYDLNALVSGDAITVRTVQGTFHYVVVRSDVVPPTDLGVLAPSEDPELTLTTCTPRYSAAERLVVMARLVSPAAPALTPAAGRSGGGGATTVAAPPVDAVHRPADWLWLGVWILAGTALVALVALARRRIGTGRAWVAPVAAAPVALVVLFFLFGAVNALLPTSL
jgi:sortase A